MSDRRKDISFAGAEADEDMMPKFTYEELLKELAHELENPVVPPGAVTVKMLADESGRSERKCRAFLNDRVKSGKMKMVQVNITKWYFISTG